MAKMKFYGSGFPYLEKEHLKGKLIVLEGTDGVGRSTQVAMLKRWLEKNSFAVSDTGLRRSPLTQPGLDKAKEGNTLSPTTLSLFYATDFADRLENQIIPAMGAGFHVLSDRYFYSIMARDVVRGLDPKWTREVYGFALIPDMVIYLKADIPTLVTRIVHGRGFNFWESGMDIIKEQNLYDSFIQYQTCMIEQFDTMAQEYHFKVVDANRSVKEVFADIKVLVEKLISPSRESREKNP
ncbi:MAG: Thymidylate kinase [Anaerolinea thermophila]|uniref:Thymidylate kinase n=1 Tax=Anaerolinea thermophila TaxID=167964 RepID=A0A101FZ51_9CHLR|nr:MAG: Thymidylate kinase [Anaerolinea thermophila]